MALVDCDDKQMNQRDLLSHGEELICWEKGGSSEKMSIRTKWSPIGKEDPGSEFLLWERSKGRDWCADWSTENLDFNVGKGSDGSM